MEKRNGLFYGWVVLAAAFLTLVLGYAIRNTFSVFYPTIVEEFGWGRGNTALMFSISIIVYGVAAPVAGSLVDRFRPRLILPIGAFIMGGSVVLCGIATRPWHFYLFYGVMVATGLSFIGWAPLSAIISNWFFRKRGLAFGVLAAGFGGSLVFAPVAQFLISTFGWQAAYGIIGLSAIAIAHQVFFFRDVGYTPMAAAKIYSVFGVTFVFGTLSSFISDRLGREKVFIPSCFLSALAVCLLFLIKDASQPWMAFVFAGFLGFGIGIAGAVFFTTVADLFQGRHFGSIQGTVVLGFSLGGAVAPWLAGFIHDRTGSYFPTFLILLVSLLICMLLMWLVSALRLRPIPDRP